MLAFIRNDVINNVEKFLDRNSDVEFLVYFPDKGISEFFPELDTAAGKFPPIPFVSGLFASFGKKELSFAILNDCADTDAYVVNASLHSS